MYNENILNKTNDFMETLKQRLYNNLWYRARIDYENIIVNGNLYIPQRTAQCDHGVYNEFEMSKYGFVIRIPLNSIHSNNLEILLQNAVLSLVSKFLFSPQNEL